MRLPYHRIGEIPPAALIAAGVIVLILILAGIYMLLPQEQVPETKENRTEDTGPGTNMSQETEPEATVCSDTDAGKNIFEAGEASRDSENAQDSCADAKRLNEFFCLDGQIANETLDCPAGYECRLGECAVKPEEIPPCLDSDEGTDYLTAGHVEYRGKNYSDECVMVDQVREYYCRDGSLKSTNFVCDPGSQCKAGRCFELPANCTDSDGGKDKFKIGTLTIYKGYMMTSMEKDYCIDSNNVREYFCSDSTVGSEVMECGENYECEDGICVYRSCQDSDGGQNLMKKGTTNKGPVIETDSCSGSYNVVEYFCSDNNIQSSTNTCPSGYWCQSGECVSEPSCSDSDGGKDYWNPGTVTKGSDTHKDICNGIVLTEYYCDGKSVKSEQFTCPDMCDTDFCRVT